MAGTDSFRFRVLRFVLRAVLRPLFRVQLSGDRNVFVNERTLIVANHESFLDGALLGSFLPVGATFVVHTQVKSKWYFRWLLNLVPHLAVDSTSPMAMKLICRLVETGTPVVIFPEGRLTITGSLMKVYDGAAFVAAKTGATVVPVRIEGAGRSYFGRLAGIYPLRLLPKIRIMIQPRRSIPMPQLPSAKLRRRRAGELMRHILLDMLVTTRPRRTLYQTFLDARATFGSGYRLVEDVRLQEESYGSLLRMALGLGRLLSTDTHVGEMVGILTPNAAPTLGLVLGLSATGRVPAMLNYTAGRDGLRAACTVACIRHIVASRTFLERARLTQLVEGLPNIKVHYLEDLRARLRYVVAGAEKLSEEVRRMWIEKFGIRVLEGYGVTECAPVIAVNVPLACRIGSVGQVVPGMQYELEPVPGVAGAGVMHVSGPNVMKGYLLHDRPGVIQPPASIRPGWYCTGDIVSVDEDDFVHIRGRVKRFAKIAGEMISLEVVERIAAAAAKSLGAPDLAVPRVLNRVMEIPLLGTGKTDYVRLKAMAETPTASAA